MSTVRSAPLPGRDRRLEIVRSLPWRLGGMGAFVVGLAFWLVGARYTVLGGPQVVGFFLGLFGIQFAVSLPSGWLLLALTVLVGAVVSAVEFGCRPRRSYFSKSLLLAGAAAVLWLLFNGADWLSTFVGVTAVQSDSFPITRWLASTLPVAVLWATFLTYFPELLMIAAARWIIGGRF